MKKNSKYVKKSFCNVAFYFLFWINLTHTPKSLRSFTWNYSVCKLNWIFFFSGLTDWRLILFFYKNLFISILILNYVLTRSFILEADELLWWPLLTLLDHVGLELAGDAGLKLFCKVVFLVAGSLFHSLEIEPRWSP